MKTLWSQAMIIGRVVKNTVGFIDGSLPQPTWDLLNSWIICNNIVTAWIFNAISRDISANFNFSDTARDIWLDLEQRYQRKNLPRIFNLWLEISNLTQDQISVTAYYAKLKSLWNELVSYRPSCSCNIP